MLERDPVQRLLGMATEVMSVEDYVMLERPAGGLRVRGRLLDGAEASHRLVSERLRPLGYVALFEREGGRDVVTFVPHTPTQQRQRPRLAIALLVATVLSTLFVGGTMVQPDLAGILRHPLSGLPFAASLLAILGIHEMGHFLTARHYGVSVSLPYFIPLPIGPFGTMGAFISMRDIPLNKRHLLRIGVAGPLSGLAVALVVLLVGLATSQVGPTPAGVPFYREGNSLLYAALKYAVFQRWLPSGGVDVNLSSVAFAGWAGLLVTGLNLIPAAQLDGGHVAYALLGRRARWLTIAIAVALLALGIRWQGWLLWAAIILLLGSRQQAVLDDITPLTTRERLLALFTLLVFVLVFVPLPLTIVQL